MAAGPVFAAQLQRWIAQVVCDRSLWKHPTAIRLAMLIAAHLNRLTLEAFPSQPRLAALLGVKEEAVRRAVLVLEKAEHLTFTPGRGHGIATRYRPIIRPENPLVLEEGFADGKCGADRERNPSSEASKPLLQEEGGTSRTLSTRSFATCGPTLDAIGPGAEETLQAFAWRMAKAFPAKRGGVLKAAADLRAFLEAEHATRAEIEAGVRAWAPYFEACFAENRHHTGATMAGWLEAEHFRFDPRDVHGWIPEDETSELFS